MIVDSGYITSQCGVFSGINNYLTIERFRRRHKLSDITIGDLSKLQNPNKKRSYDAIANPELIVRRLVRRLTFMNRPPAVIP